MSYSTELQLNYFQMLIQLFLVFTHVSKEKHIVLRVIKSYLSGGNYLVFGVDIFSSLLFNKFSF